MPNERMAAVIAAALAEQLPPNVLLMRVLAEAEPGRNLPALLREAGRLATANDEDRTRLADAERLLGAHPDAWRTVRAVLAEADHGAGPEGDGVARWEAVFDRLARTAPEAAVALYALGSPDLLAAATAELVGALRDRRLTGPDRDVVEIGCGIGRISLALAAEVRSVLGLDVSAGMIAEAERRAVGTGNARFRRTDGRDLSGIADRSVDLVLAADVFPYLVSAGDDLPGRHVAEAARVLRPAGALLILNYSYRGSLDRDRAEVGRLFARSGLRDEPAAFALRLWDAAAFLAYAP